MAVKKSEASDRATFSPLGPIGGIHQLTDTLSKGLGEWFAQSTTWDATVGAGFVAGHLAVAGHRRQTYTAASRLMIQALLVGHEIWAEGLGLAY
jgi:hypothetical protein